MYTSSHLDYFGKKLMEMVRDNVIYKFDKICMDEIKSEEALKLAEKINSFSSDEREKLRSIVINSIDTSMVNFLTMLQECEDSIALNITINTETQNLVSISDGLGGELFGEDGLMKRFSEYGESD